MDYTQDVITAFSENYYNNLRAAKQIPPQQQDVAQGRWVEENIYECFCKITGNGVRFRVRTKLSEDSTDRKLQLIGDTQDAAEFLCQLFVHRKRDERVDMTSVPPTHK